LSILDPSLDPRTHPEVLAGRLKPTEVHPVQEKMLLEFSLNPREVSEEAFLTAYGMFLEQRIKLDQVASRARAIEADLRQRDAIIARSV
jgi:hypothetical protein